MDEGMIYFIKCEKADAIKVGFVSGRNALSVAHRLQSLQGANPFKLKIIGFLRGTLKQERLIHEAMAKHRISGEWFSMNSFMGKIIKERSIMNNTDAEVFDGTVSADEIEKQIQKDHHSDIYYKDFCQYLTGNNGVPCHRAFGIKRFKYLECVEFTKKNFKNLKIFSGGPHVNPAHITK